MESQSACSALEEANLIQGVPWVGSKAAMGFSSIKNGMVPTRSLSCFFLKRNYLSEVPSWFHKSKSFITGWTISGSSPSNLELPSSNLELPSSNLELPSSNLKLCRLCPSSPIFLHQPLSTLINQRASPTRPALPRPPW